MREFDVAVFAASCDTVEDNTKFAKQLELDYPILSDPERKVAPVHGVVDEKQKYPRRWTIFIGKDGVVKHIEKKVDTRGHGTQVLKQLAELKVDKVAKETEDK
ncbi:MAG: peroxiredoxin family protein [Planctomycetales bacterium]|nr:peroxiredoxin family protein [Planctomycetales bacterium]